VTLATVLSVERISKVYRLGSIGASTLEADFSRWWARLRGRPDPLTKVGTGDHARLVGDQFWALEDVSFQVTQGEVLGIIGRNGAGKSTLLKILSQITAPSGGRIRIRGRVASLLEVGTGFHPDLTGRENVFLNGAILGMSRAEIRRKLDAIVAFAEMEEFLETPVKRYSSGMYVRLAFAVAAHLEPEILIVDEVLAVGDASFQERCIGKMQGVAGEGRTVLFVSHNMTAVQQLCTRALLLRQGRIHSGGDPATIVGEYLSDARPQSTHDLSDWHDRTGSGDGRVLELTVTDRNGTPSTLFRLGDTIGFELTTEFRTPVVDPNFGVVIHGPGGEPLLDPESVHGGLRLGRVEGRMAVRGTVPNIGLYPGRYYLTPWITDAAGRPIDVVRLCSSIEVIPTPGPHGDLRLDPLWGKYFVPSTWEQIGSSEARRSLAAAATESR
jgi:lipopolysaccharide transport system ATP-binding protein